MAPPGSGAVGSDSASFLQNGLETLLGILPAARSIIICENGTGANEDVIFGDQPIPEKNTALDRHAVAPVTICAKAHTRVPSPIETPCSMIA
jgi:hypothetical protein